MIYMSLGSVMIQCLVSNRSNGSGFIVFSFDDNNAHEIFQVSMFNMATDIIRCPALKIKWHSIVSIYGNTLSYDTRQFEVVELRCKHHVTHFLFVWRTPTANIVYKRGSIHAMKCINGEQLSNRFCKQTHHESPHQLICVLLLMRSRRRLAIAADLPRISWKVGSVCDSNWIHILIVIA